MNKINYTEKEIESLEYYSSRKSPSLFKNYYNYNGVNNFLRYLSRDGYRDKTLPIHLSNVDAFKEFLENIANLYVVTCKYGFTHRTPSILYRGDYGASAIERNSYSEDVVGMTSWDTDAFISCSRSLSETDVFSGHDGPKIEVSSDYIFDGIYSIPFVDVNDLLGSDQFYGDEKEVLFPPFMKTIVNYTSKNWYEITMTNVCKMPINSEEIDDEFLANYLDVSKKVLDTHDYDGEASKLLEKYRIKLRSYMQEILSSINYITSIYVRGFISEEEYEQKKKEILSNITISYDKGKGTY